MSTQPNRIERVDGDTSYMSLEDFGRFTLRAVKSEGKTFWFKGRPWIMCFVCLVVREYPKVHTCGGAT